MTALSFWGSTTIKETPNLTGSWKSARSKNVISACNVKLLIYGGMLYLNNQSKTTWDCKDLSRNVFVIGSSKQYIEVKSYIFVSTALNLLEMSFGTAQNIV